MQAGMIEVYRIILEKGFKPSVKLVLEGYYLTLTHPSGKYQTRYKIVNGKIKWFAGVMPHRILK